VAGGGVRAAREDRDLERHVVLDAARIAGLAERAVAPAFDAAVEAHAACEALATDGDRAIAAAEVGERRRAAIGGARRGRLVVVARAVATRAGLGVAERAEAMIAETRELIRSVEAAAEVDADRDRARAVERCFVVR